jgi:phage shock protein A
MLVHMAGTWQRVKGIFQAKANKVLDKAEDPRDTLDLSYEKQLQQLQKIRRSVADVATARKRIELQAQGLQKQADKLQGQAKAALQQNNEDLAREALSRRAALGEQLAELKTQHDQITEQEQKLVDTSQQLQSRVEQFRTKKETLKASPRSARRCPASQTPWAARPPPCSGPRTRSPACRPAPAPSTSCWLRGR